MTNQVQVLYYMYTREYSQSSILCLVYRVPGIPEKAVGGLAPDVSARGTLGVVKRTPQGGAFVDVAVL